MWQWLKISEYDVIYSLEDWRYIYVCISVQETLQELTVRRAFWTVVNVAVSFGVTFTKRLFFFSKSVRAWLYRWQRARKGCECVNFESWRHWKCFSSQTIYIKNKSNHVLYVSFCQTRSFKMCKWRISISSWWFCAVGYVARSSYITYWLFPNKWGEMSSSVTMVSTPLAKCLNESQKWSFELLDADVTLADTDGFVQGIMWGPPLRAIVPLYGRFYDPAIVRD